MNRKIKDVNVDDKIAEIKKAMADIETEMKTADYEEYIRKYYYLMYIVLYELESWERNIFIVKHFCDTTGVQMAEAFGIAPHTLYQYTGNITKKIKQLIKKYGY